MFYLNPFGKFGQPYLPPAVHKKWRQIVGSLYSEEGITMLPGHFGCVQWIFWTILCFILYTLSPLSGNSGRLICRQRSTGSESCRSLVGCHPKKASQCCRVILAVFSEFYFYFLFFVWFYTLYFPFLEIRTSLNWVRLQQPQGQHYPVLQVHAGSFRVSVNHRTLTWTIGIFNWTCVPAHSFACEYTRGLGTPTASQHNKFDSEKLS